MGANHNPILIVGGGLGGLSAALALGQKRFAVRVLEQAPEIEPIGYGIQLGPNVFPMLERLGLMDAVLATRSFERLRVARRRGRLEIERVPTGPERSAGSNIPTSSFTGSICTASCSTPAARCRASSSHPRPR